MAPVTQGVNVTHEEAVFQALADIGQTSGDLASNKGFAPAWTFVVKQDAITGKYAVGLAVVDRNPVGIHLGHCVGATRIERCGFLLRDFLHQAIELAGAGLIKAGFLLQAQDANGFQNAQGAHAVHVGGVFGALKANSNVALGAEIVDFIGLGFLHDACKVTAVSKVAVVQLEADVVNMRVLVNVVNPLSVKQASPALDTVYYIAFFQEKFS